MQVFPPLAAVLTTVMALAPRSVSATNCTTWSTRYQQDIEGVCVCSTSDCDSIYNGHLFLQSGEAGVFQTSKAGHRLDFSTISTSSNVSDSADIVIDTSIKYQSINGFGGAFTDASAINVNLLTSTLQEDLLEAYFGDSGLQYTLGRIPISSTDFSLTIYSYNDVEGDLAMENFSIDMDKTSGKIDLIHRAVAKNSRDMRFFGSSWAPPAWMTNENSTINCSVKGYPGGEYWEALALYYSKFISAYEAEGIPIWAMTTQNEPTQAAGATKFWQSLRFNETTERDFIKFDLGPTLKANNPDTKIIMMDDQKTLLPDWDAALVDEEARQYVSGLGVHWYQDLDLVTDRLGAFAQLSTFHETYPDIFILATEACEGYLVDGLGTGAGIKLLNGLDIVWKRGEIYARDIINDLANYATGWMDWNLALNTSGGPTWINNNVDSPILVDEENGIEFYKQPMYYAMGHIAKFLPVDSVRVNMALTTDATTELASVDKVAFTTPDNQVVLILSNRDTTDHTVSVSLTQEGISANLTLLANSIQTVVFGEARRSSC